MEVSKMCEKRKKTEQKTTLIERVIILDEKIEPLKRAMDNFFCRLFGGCEEKGDSYE